MVIQIGTWIQGVILGNLGFIDDKIYLFILLRDMECSHFRQSDLHKLICLNLTKRQLVLLPKVAENLFPIHWAIGSSNKQNVDTKLYFEKTLVEDN